MADNLGDNLEVRIKMYERLKENRNEITNIDTNFFFDFVDELLKEYRSQQHAIDESVCLHCGKGKPAYCEDCYQELIAENAKLQMAKHSKTKCTDRDQLTCNVEKMRLRRLLLS